MKGLRGSERKYCREEEFAVRLIWERTTFRGLQEGKGLGGSEHKSCRAKRFGIRIKERPRTFSGLQKVKGLGESDRNYCRATICGESHMGENELSVGSRK